MDISPCSWWAAVGASTQLAWKLAQSDRVARVLVAPGNAGTAGEHGVENVAVGAEDIDGLVALARERSVDLTVVGPEAPLVAGIADRVSGGRGLHIFGPSAAAARLEGSKAFTKAFLASHGIPTARYAEFTDPSEAAAHVREHGTPIVVKAGRTGGGQGRWSWRIRRTWHSPRWTTCSPAGRSGTRGAESSSRNFSPARKQASSAWWEAARHCPSHRRRTTRAAGEGDTGPNTGGMGAYSPAPVVDAAVHERIMREIVRPTVEGLVASGTPYTGFLYAGPDDRYRRCATGHRVQLSSR